MYFALLTLVYSDFVIYGRLTSFFGYKINLLRTKYLIQHLNGGQHFRHASGRCPSFPFRYINEGSMPLLFSSEEKRDKCRELLLHGKTMVKLSTNCRIGSWGNEKTFLTVIKLLSPLKCGGFWL